MAAGFSFSVRLMIRSAVQELQQLGKFPSYSAGVTDKRITQYDDLLKSIVPPVNDDEAAILAALLGPDDFYGLAWTTVHLIETAPNWGSRVAVPEANLEWREILEQRLQSG